MRLLLGLLTYLMASVAIVGGAAAFLFSAAEPAGTTVRAQQERNVGPRIQAWLDRKAEARVYAEKEQAAALAEKERAEALRRKASSTAAHAAFARARDNEGKPDAGRENAAQTKESSKREAGRRSHQLRETEPSGSPRASYQQSLQYYPDVHGRSH